jgi:glycosyltransferase involved in cell wall biosynthesis
MRIAMLYTPLTTPGGGERQFLEEMRHLAARGHDVAGLTFRLDRRALFVDGAERLPITVLHAPSPPMQVAALRRSLRRLNPDVLLAHTSPELTWLATRGLGLVYVQYHNSPPFYIGAHANPYMASRRYRRIFPRVLREAAGYEELAEAAGSSPQVRMEAELRTWLKHRALRAARAVVVPSRRSARELKMLHGIDATVVRGCLPSTILGQEHERPASSRPATVLSVCRLEPVKRIDLLLRAFARVRQELPETQLVVTGEGSEGARLRAIARHLGLGESVRFAGYVEDAALPALFAEADVFASPAMADFAVAPYEALAAGCAIVWTSEMETDAAIEQSGRVFVAEPEERDVARALLAALRAPRGAAPDLHALTWDSRAAQLESLLGDVRRAA